MDSTRSRWPGRRAALWFSLLTTLSTGCDLGTKAWAEQTLVVPGASVSVVEPWLELSLAYNRGTAFSLVPHLGDARWVFALLAAGIVALLLLLVLRRRPRGAELVALGMIAGGALGNGYDRAFRLTPAGDTGVVDFIRVHITSTYSWPTFNVADALLLIGVAWLLWLGLRRSGPDPDRSSDGPDAMATTAATAARS